MPVRHQQWYIRPWKGGLSVAGAGSKGAADPETRQTALTDLLRRFLLHSDFYEGIT